MNIKLIFFLGLLIRLIISIISADVKNFDTDSYLIIGRLILNKEHIYPNLALLRYPYFPFYLYIEALSVYLNNFGINYMLTIKIINSFFDGFIIYLLYLLSKKSIKIAFLYAINPISILIGSFHGQFDSIPIFFLLISIYLFKKNQILSLLSYSFSIMLKTWPIFFFLIYLNKIKKISYIFLIFFFPILSTFLYSLIFKENPIDIFLTIIKYKGFFGFFGISQIIIFLEKSLKFIINIHFHQRLLEAILLASLLIFSLMLKRKTLIKAIELILFFFYTVSPFFAIQYFSWIVPFLILKIKEKFNKIILIITSFYIAINYLEYVLKLNKSIKFFLLILGFFLWSLFLRKLIYEIKQN